MTTNEASIAAAVGGVSFPLHLGGVSGRFGDSVAVIPCARIGSRDWLSGW